MRILVQENFEKVLNETFEIRLTETDKIELQLTEVKPMPVRLSPHSDVPPTRTPFKLLFQANSNYRLKQATFPMTNATLGALDPGIFLVPISEDANGQYYEAIFT